MRADRPREAIELFHRALKLKPGYAMAQNDLGIALALNEDIDGAICHFKEAVRLLPDYANAHYNLAIALRGRGRQEDAIVQLKRSIELQPDNAPAVEMLRDWQRSN
jgi:tetratricopeptide (TPR) repeat protein